MSDLYATRSYIIEQIDDLSLNIVICKSGLTEKRYSLGRALSELKNGPLVMHRVPVSQHFIDNLEESRLVLDTEMDNSISSTQLWVGEAV